jgi:hypothetical protein
MKIDQTNFALLLGAIFYLFLLNGHAFAKKMFFFFKEMGSLPPAVLSSKNS